MNLELVGRRFERENHHRPIPRRMIRWVIWLLVLSWSVVFTTKVEKQNFDLSLLQRLNPFDLPSQYTIGELGNPLDPNRTDYLYAWLKSDKIHALAGVLANTCLLSTNVSAQHELYSIYFECEGRMAYKRIFMGYNCDPKLQTSVVVYKLDKTLIKHGYAITFKGCKKYLTQQNHNDPTEKRSMNNRFWITAK